MGVTTRRRAPRGLLFTMTAMLSLAGGCDDRPVATTAGAPASTGSGTPPASGRDVDATPSSADAPSPGPRGRAGENPPGWPPIEFEPARLDFGVLAPGETARGLVRLWNTGSQPLTIAASRTSCGCTSTDRLDGRVVPAGGSIDFDVAMEPKSGLGEKREGVRIIFDGVPVPVVYYFHAEVSRAVRATPPHITAVDTDAGQLFMTGEVELRAIDGRAFRILSSNGASPTLVGFDPATDPPRDQYTLRWDISQLHARREVPWFWIVETDHPDAPIVDLRIRHPTTVPSRPPNRPWVPKDQRAIIDVVRPGEPVEVSAKLEYQPNRAPQPQTAAARSESDRMDVQLIDATADGQVVTVRLAITPRTTEPGLLYEQATIEMSGFEMPLRIIGRVE